MMYLQAQMELGGLLHHYKNWSINDVFKATGSLIVALEIVIFFYATNLVVTSHNVLTCQSRRYDKDCVNPQYNHAMHE